MTRLPSLIVRSVLAAAKMLRRFCEDSAMASGGSSIASTMIGDASKVACARYLGRTVFARRETMLYFGDTENTDALLSSDQSSHLYDFSALDAAH